MYKQEDAENASPSANEFDELSNFKFSEKSIRQAFVRKVYLVLMAQLVLTFGLVSLFTLHEPTAQLARENVGVVFVLMIVTLVMVLAMACCEGVRRKAPMNYIFLFTFTIAEGLILGFVGALMQDKKYVVMLAIGITAVICLSLTLFAFQTKYDFTGCGTYLFIALICLIIFGFVLSFVDGEVDTANKIYAGLGALLFSFYLVYDTQLMMGGNHKYSLSPEEYVFAALNLYLDIINIFIYILRLIR